VYASKTPPELSWYQPEPARSLELLDRLGIEPTSAIIDVGGGASTLVDALLDRGARNVTVLDISAAALAHARARLGARAASVAWIEADITRVDLGTGVYDVWHDRAVFHFLTDEGNRRAYVAAMSRALRTGGIALIATFAPDGPQRCSGLEVVRYDAEGLAREVGNDFALDRAVHDVHHTPTGKAQAFTFAVLRRL
jgi:SAM-dependent methyltransferase